MVRFPSVILIQCCAVIIVLVHLNFVGSVLSLDVTNSNCTESTNKKIEKSNEIMHVHKLSHKIFSTGRGKVHKQKKLLKLIYPVLVAVFAIKSVVMPMMIKALTALSTSSFVMSKMAFVLSGIMIAKWLFGLNSEQKVSKTRLEVYQVPYKKPVSWETREKNIKYIPLHNEEFDNLMDIPNYKQSPFL